MIHEWVSCVADDVLCWPCGKAWASKFISNDSYLTIKTTIPIIPGYFCDCSNTLFCCYLNFGNPNSTNGPTVCFRSFQCCYYTKNNKLDRFNQTLIWVFSTGTFGRAKSCSADLHFYCPFNQKDGLPPEEGQSLPSRPTARLRWHLGGCGQLLTIHYFPPWNKRLIFFSSKQRSDFPLQRLFVLLDKFYISFTITPAYNAK